MNRLRRNFIGTALILASAVYCGKDTSGLRLDNVVSIVSISPSSPLVQVGTSALLVATPQDANGNPIIGTSIAWSSSDSSVATVNSQGMVQGIAVGVVTISATAGGKTGSTQVTVTSTPVPPQSGDPKPDANDRIIVDSRQTLQAATTIREMFAAVTGRPSNDATNPGLATDPWSLALDIDGHGTNAIRRTWRAFCCGDRDGNGYIQTMLGQLGSAPKEVYVQWKQLLGRTPTGGGIGGIGTFQVHNPADVGHNAGRKNLLVLRDVPDQGGSERFDYLWYGGGGIAVGLSNNVAPGTFNPQQYVGQVLTQTLYLRAASTPGASDAINRLWVNGRLVGDFRGPFGHYGYHRTQFPSTFRSPAQDQTEYFWDVLVWQPR